MGGERRVGEGRGVSALRDRWGREGRGGAKGGRDRRGGEGEERDRRGGGGGERDRRGGGGIYCNWLVYNIVAEHLNTRCE